MLYQPARSITFIVKSKVLPVMFTGAWTIISSKSAGGTCRISFAKEWVATNIVATAKQKLAIVEDVVQKFIIIFDLKKTIVWRNS